ncbi:hypothetical protein HanPI659440_Chr04g0142441 [Helianthus annuus]|nr:hypothetical protein HanPI659440_Chr04g0142441 [Helianthus annuus]
MVTEGCTATGVAGWGDGAAPRRKRGAHMFCSVLDVEIPTERTMTGRRRGAAWRGGRRRLLDGPIPSSLRPSCRTIYKKSR